MSAVAPTGITIELETLTRLLAAAHLHECAEWSEAQLKAEDDLRTWRGHAPSIRQQSISIVPNALTHIVDAAEDGMRLSAASEGPWVSQVATDVAYFGQICRNSIAAHSRDKPCGAERHGITDSSPSIEPERRLR